MKKPLTGRESSILTLFAQCKDIPKEDVDRIIADLDGRAHDIAMAILNKEDKHSEEIKLTAQSYIDWANDLPVTRR